MCYCCAPAFVGPAGDVHRLLEEVGKSHKSLQEAFTALYLKDALRKKFGLGIDHQSTLFQNLQGASGQKY